MYRQVLRSAQFFELLLKIDREKLEEVRAGRCLKPGCGGPLYSGHFSRKPRGLGPGEGQVPEGFEVRFDLCCGRCRRRTMPQSVRFLGRKVYLGAVIAIATVVVRGANRDAVRILRSHLDVSLNTLVRWRGWWQELTRSAFWLSIGGVLPLGLDLEQLPKSLLDCFAGDPAERLLCLMRLLGPITARGFPVMLKESQ